jgi:phosphoenolpyruvate synthase/pyruvate phosphate dikinase
MSWGNARVTGSIRPCSGAAPEFLGPRDMGPPPVDWFPSGARRTAKATEAIILSIFKEAPKTPSSPGKARGIPASPGIWEGTARVITSSEDFPRIRKGDVVIARSTSPSFNIVLPLIGALVAERGGSLSHAAVVAREYGMPGVVGARGVMEMVRDGDRVRVDGDKGEIEVVG